MQYIHWRTARRGSEHSNGNHGPRAQAFHSAGGEWLHATTKQTKTTDSAAALIRASGLACAKPQGLVSPCIALAHPDVAQTATSVWHCQRLHHAYISLPPSAGARRARWWLAAFTCGRAAHMAGRGLFHRCHMRVLDQPRAGCSVVVALVVGSLGGKMAAGSVRESVTE